MSAENSKKLPAKRRKYDDAFKAEALRLASESRSTQTAARQLCISPKLLYRWQEAQLVPKWAAWKWPATRKCANYAPS